MSASSSIPVVVCGAREAIGQTVLEGLKPEYDVILFCIGAQALATELPLLLTSPQTFTPQSSQIGSFTTFSPSSPPPASRFPPRAILFGGAWGPDDIASVQSALKGVPHADKIALFRNNPDVQKQAAEEGVVPGSPGYTEMIIRRNKVALGKLINGEELDKVPGMEGVYWY